MKKYLAACALIVGCAAMSSPVFAGDTRIIIKADFGLFDHVRYSYFDRHHDRYFDRHYNSRYFDRHYDRRYNRHISRHFDRHRHNRTVIIHRAPRVIIAPFGSHRHHFWQDGRRGIDKHWKRHDRHYDNRRFRDDHRERDRRHRYYR